MEGIVFKKDRMTELAIRMKKGDRKAAAELYDELLPKAYGFFFSRTNRREVAEDLTQDVFLKLVEKVESFDEKKGAFVVWFWRVARNMLIDHYRGKTETVFSTFEESDVEMMATTEMPSIDVRLHHQKLVVFLKTLGDEERELFELRYVAEMPYKEIATLLGKSEGSLRVATMRIKEKIKKELKDEI